MLRAAERERIIVAAWQSGGHRRCEPSFARTDQHDVRAQRAPGLSGHVEVPAPASVFTVSWPVRSSRTWVPVGCVRSPSVGPGHQALAQLLARPSTASAPGDRAGGGRDRVRLRSSAGSRIVGDPLRPCLSSAARTAHDLGVDTVWLNCDVVKLGERAGALRARDPRAVSPRGRRMRIARAWARVARMSFDAGTHGPAACQVSSALWRSSGSSMRRERRCAAGGRRLRTRGSFRPLRRSIRATMDRKITDRACGSFVAGAAHTR